MALRELSSPARFHATQIMGDPPSTEFSLAPLGMSMRTARLRG
jgi:hypothetical protein